ncbi:unnamed protein product [marine sediment metagenome]|uniref:Elongation factor 1-beta n=1 Tax=marine sediment metagenome TaxID=412755 RepID=X1MZH2_9ZZZZ
MGIAAVKVKLMPSSPDINLEEVEKKARKILEEKEVKNPQFEKQAIAFGLNALIILFAWPEEKELEELENNLKKIEDVKSVNVIDIRRAIG